jgi:hypothetical protein
MAFEHRRSWHGITTPFLTWLSVYIFIFTKISPLFNLFAYIFIQSYVNSNLHVSTLYILFMDNIKSIKIYSGVTQLGTCFIYIYLFTIYDVNKYIYIYETSACVVWVRIMFKFWNSDFVGPFRLSEIRQHTRGNFQLNNFKEKESKLDENFNSICLHEICEISEFGLLIEIKCIFMRANSPLIWYCFAHKKGYILKFPLQKRK